MERLPRQGRDRRLAAARQEEGRHARRRRQTKPESPPASGENLRDYLRRSLFGIPPARLPKRRGKDGQTLRPLPARKAKLALIEVARDLAVEDSAFAERVAPLFLEFVQSEGASERAACLVALTRIRHAHPTLPAFADEEAA